MGQIIITVKALNWSYGNIGEVRLLLNGGSCRIDWGDGHVSSISVPPYSKKPEWYGASHAYPASCMAAEERFNIYVSSGDDDNIIGIDAGSGVSEWLFSEYYADIVPPAQIALVVSLVWRIFSYYIYLLVGLVVIPSWLKKRK